MGRHLTELHVVVRDAPMEMTRGEREANGMMYTSTSVTKDLAAVVRVNAAAPHFQRRVLGVTEGCTSLDCGGAKYTIRYNCQRY